MTHFALIGLTCAIMCITACGSSSDGAADASPTLDADLSVCLPDNLWHVIADRPVRVGDYCDDIQLCAKNAAAAEAIRMIEPGFTCGDPPGQAGCAASERYCVWSTPDTIDSDAYADLCAIAVSGDTPSRLSCLVYL